MATTFPGAENSFRVSGISRSRIQEIREKLSRVLKNLVNSIQDNTKSEMISQIENEINATLSEVHGDVDVIELELPQIKAKGKKRDKIFEAIHNIFDAEIIDNKLFSKYNNGVKAEIHSKLTYSLDQQLPTWWNQIDTICVVNGNQYRPDVGGWNPKPTLDQR
ncbi:3014_t:CDS:2, partial [Ambispora leptoticha]